MADHQIEYKLRLTMSAQAGSKPKVTTTKIRQELETVRQYVIRDVVIQVSNDQFEVGKAELERQIGDIVHDETIKLTRMLVSGLTSVRRGGKGPKGDLRTSDASGKSDLGRAFARGDNTARASEFGVEWTPLSRPYYQHKLASNRSPNFWRYGNLDEDKALKDWLANPDGFYAAFGPVTVQFVRSQRRDSAGRFFRPDGKEITTSTGLTGRPGANTPNVIGRLEVGVFGDITADMLPALASGDLDNLPAKPNEHFYGMLPRGVAAKLLPNHRNKKPWRMAIEPFIGWYLTRAVPYVVARRVGRVLSKRNERAITAGDLRQR